MEKRKVSVWFAEVTAKAHKEIKEAIERELEVMKSFEIAHCAQENDTSIERFTLYKETPLICDVTLRNPFARESLSLIDPLPLRLRAAAHRPAPGLLECVELRIVNGSDLSPDVDLKRESFAATVLKDLLHLATTAYAAEGNDEALRRLKATRTFTYQVLRDESNSLYSHVIVRVAEEEDIAFHEKREQTRAKVEMKKKQESESEGKKTTHEEEHAENKQGEGKKKKPRKKKNKTVAAKEEDRSDDENSEPPADREDSSLKTTAPADNKENDCDNNTDQDSQASVRSASVSSGSMPSLSDCDSQAGNSPQKNNEPPAEGVVKATTPDNKEDNRGDNTDHQVSSGSVLSPPADNNKENDCDNNTDQTKVDCCDKSPLDDAPTQTSRTDATAEAGENNPPTNANIDADEFLSSFASSNTVDPNLMLRWMVSMQTEIRSLKNGKEEMQTRIQSLQNGKEEMQTRIQSLQNGKEEMQTEIQSLKRKVEKMEGKIQSLENEITMLIFRLDGIPYAEYFTSFKTTFDTAEKKIKIAAKTGAEVCDAEVLKEMDFDYARYQELKDWKDNLNKFKHQERIGEYNDLRDIVLAAALQGLNCDAVLAPAAERWGLQATWADVQKKVAMDLDRLQQASAQKKESLDLQDGEQQQLYNVRKSIKIDKLPLPDAANVAYLILFMHRADNLQYLKINSKK